MNEDKTRRLEIHIWVGGHGDQPVSKTVGRWVRFPAGSPI